MPIVPPGVETRVGLYFCPTIPLMGSKGNRIGVPTRNPTATMRYGNLSRVWNTSGEWRIHCWFGDILRCRVDTPPLAY